MADTPIGVVYTTSMTRPDAALALASMYPMEGKRESHMGSVCIVGAGFNAAVFCDIIGKMYSFGTRNGNQALAVGLALDAGVPDSPMVKSAVEHKTEKGDPMYARTIQRVSDTSAADAVVRNGVIFNSTSTVILSGPATYLARSLDLRGTIDLYKQRVKSLVIVDAGTPYKDAAALRKVIAEWPTPVFFCSKETGEAFKFPGATLDKSFAWAPAHPVVDAYKAYKPMPYDAPLYDLVGTYFAIHPESDMFKLTSGNLAVSDDGAMRFTPGSGNVKSIGFDPAKKADLQKTLVDAAIAQPVIPAPGGRGGGRGGSGRGAFGFSGGGRGGFGFSGGRGNAPVTPAIVPPAVIK